MEDRTLESFAGLLKLGGLLGTEYLIEFMRVQKFSMGYIRCRIGWSTRRR